MADRTSAEIFSKVFKHLAAHNTPENRAFAREMWDAAGKFDFSWYQMHCDDALVELGLARCGVHPDYPKDGEVVLYKGDPGGPE